MQRKVKINSSDYFYELDYVNFPPKPYTLLYFLHFCSKYIIIRKKKISIIFLITKLSHGEIKMANNYMKIFNLSNKKCKERSMTQNMFVIYI